MKRLVPTLLLLLMCIYNSSCSKDDVFDDNTNKQDFEEICKNVVEIDYAIMNYYKQCSSIEELKQHAGEIKAIHGVDDVYFDEPTTMFVKVKGFHTMSYSYYPEDDEATMLMQQQTLQRIKANAEAQGNNTEYSNPNFKNAKLLIANHQSNEAGREYTNQFTATVKTIFNSGISGITAEIENNPTIEFFQEAAFDCDYLYIITHGCYDPGTKLHWVATSTEGPRDAEGKLDRQWLQDNFGEFPLNSVGYSGGDHPVVMFSEHFIESLNVQFNHSGQAIVYNTSCSSIKGHGETPTDTIDYGLARAFELRGAGAYLGYDQTNSYGKVGGVEFFSRLASGMSINGAYNSLSFSVLHDYESDHDNPTIKFWADLKVYPEEGAFLKHCINQPVITFEDKSDDNGLRIDVRAENIYTKYAYAVSGKKWQFATLDEMKNLPLGYGFEVSESENFTDIAYSDFHTFGENGSEGAYLLYNKSLTYNASETNSKIKPETTYWARAYVYDGYGYNYSEPVTFTTGAYNRIDHVIPPDIRDQMDPYVTIYDGNNPPNIEGEFVLSPMEFVYDSQGHDLSGYSFYDTYIKFYNQNMHSNTLDYKEKSGSSESTGTGAFISGEGNNFSVFFNTEGISHHTNYDVTTKTALVISGTMGTNGIYNVEYAFVMLEKSSDPESYIMPVGAFRVFKDGDSFSQATTWASFLRRIQKRGQQQKLSIYEVGKR